jgi:alanine racemase
MVSKLDKRAGIIINLKNLESNIASLKANLPKETKFAAVVKADAYGHGAVEVSKAAVKFGADLLCFATANETVEVLKEDIDCPVMVMGPIMSDTLDLVVDFKVRQSVFLKEHILMLEKKADEKNSEAYVHIKIDTGMNRTGVKDLKAFKDLLETMIACERVVFEGMLTHFAISDEADKSFSDAQIDKFMAFVKIAKDYGFSPVLHASNSGGIIDLPKYGFDLVRGGISMYGCYPSDNVNKKAVPLMPVMSVYSSVVNINDLAVGDSVSYGRTFIAKKKTKIATIAIGYGDGFNRLLSNKASVLIAGKKANIVGRVCMDMIMVDISAIPDVRIGDDVVIIGKQGDNEITVDDHAKMCGTINYEIVLSFTNRLKRVYVYE